MVEIKMAGALEDVTLAEPFSATFSNFNASLSNGSGFFLGKTPDGSNIIVNVHRVLTVEELDEND